MHAHTQYMPGAASQIIQNRHGFAHKAAQKLLLCTLRLHTDAHAHIHAYTQLAWSCASDCAKGKVFARKAAQKLLLMSRPSPAPPVLSSLPCKPPPLSPFQYIPPLSPSTWPCSCCCCCCGCCWRWCWCSSCCRCCCCGCSPSCCCICCCWSCCCCCWSWWSGSCWLVIRA